MCRLLFSRLIIFQIAFFLSLSSHSAPSPVSSVDYHALPNREETVAQLPHLDASGQVLDSTGKPQPDANVFLYYADWPFGLCDHLAGRTRTNAEGGFNFSKSIVWGADKERNVVSVIAIHPKQGVMFANVKQGEPLNNISISLPGADSATRRKLPVLDIKGKPVAGAKVFVKYLEKQNPKGGGSEPLILSSDIGLISAITDDQGNAKVMWPGYSAGFRIQKPGFAEGEAWNSVNYDDEVSPGSCRLCPGAFLSGCITYPDGSPAADAGISVLYEGRNIRWSTSVEADSKGHYEIPYCAASGYVDPNRKLKTEKDAKGKIYAYAVDLRKDTPLVGRIEAFPVNPGNRIIKDLKLERGYVLAGQVVEVGSQKPLPSFGLKSCIGYAGVYALYEDSILTDQEGRFRFIVPSGSLASISWGDDRYIFDEEWYLRNHHIPFEQLEIRQDHADLLIPVKVWQMRPLKGHLVDEKGNNMPGASAHINDSVFSDNTDAQGLFTIPNAPMDRDYDLFAVTADRKLACVSHVATGTTYTTLTMVPTRQYTGFAADLDGTLAPNLTFTIDLEMNGDTLYGYQREVKTDGESRFTIPDLCPQTTYHANWSDEHYGWGDQIIDLAKQDAAKPIQLIVRQHINTILGRVVNEAGKPIPKATVQLGGDDTIAVDLRGEAIIADAAGNFAVPRLSAGKAELDISSEAYMQKTFTIPTDSIDFVAQLTPFTTESAVSVSVYDEAEKPVSGVPLIFSKNTGHASQNQKTPIQTDSEGRAHLTFKTKNGWGYVCCKRTGYLDYYAGFPMYEETEVSLYLRRPRDFWTGVVKDDEGTPVSNARIKIDSVACNTTSYKDMESNVHVPGYIYKTNAAGRFEIRQFSRKDFISLIIEARGYKKSMDWVFQPGETATKETFVLERVETLESDN